MVPETLKDIRVVQALEAFPGVILAAKLDRGELTLTIDPARIVDVCRLLKESLQFNRLSAVTCVDLYPRDPRFEVIYHLHAIPVGAPGAPPVRNERLRLKCALPADNPAIDSVYSVWRSADWYEREVFDLFGVTFRNHPNLKRILMPDDWQGHPLRKDYPVHGYKYSYPQQ
jgi:NADH-quinone oxidoreductase subunit C